MDLDRTTLAPTPAWLPTPEVIDRANVTNIGRQLGLADYPALHRWSIENREAYWDLVVERLGIRFRRRYERILDASQPTRPRWLVGAQMNIVDSCFQAGENAPAVIESAGDELRTWTCGELRRLTARVANGLIARGLGAGDAVAVVMPMTARSVATYLGIIAAGAAVVSIADSFAAEEIATRLRLAGAKLVFTQDVVQWGAKRLALYDKVVAAGAPPVVVLSTNAGSANSDLTPSPGTPGEGWGEGRLPSIRREKTLTLPSSGVPGEGRNGAIRPNEIALPTNGGVTGALGAGDTTFDAFLSSDERLAIVAASPQDAINILFSSGTTGEPKAIPWDHTTPLKCAADAHFHQDVHPGDVVCWPTSLGWMMGPWLIFAALLNRATMALYANAPTDAGFGTFVRDAGVTMLGVVPSLVRAWRQSGCMTGIDWSAIRAFSSSGECSNPADMVYLMDMAGGKPIIEYCGGTELGGAYVTNTVVQPCVPSMFTTPTLGLNFVLLDEEGRPAEKGEAFIEGPSIGLSSRLLNRDHDAIYYDGTPFSRAGVPLRRHGDELELLPGGYYRVAGRSDDTMNLGGIKVGCAEIERILNPLPGVQETAAVAEAGGGPSRLIIFLVPREGHTRSAMEWKPLLQQAIRSQLNPLFHVHEVVLAASLPRTASNKVMRRELRARLAT